MTTQSTRAPSPVLIVAKNQLQLMVRDNRLRLLAVAVVLLAAASLATGMARVQAQAVERHAATEEDKRLWDSLGPVNPHGAVHSGRSVYAPVAPLAAFEPGLSDFLGSSVRLEGHSQNPSRDRPMEGGVAITRFAGFSAAWALQVVAPLLIILAGFTIFSGERARERVKQELGSGASAKVLVFGRLIGLTTASLTLLGSFVAAGVITLALANASMDEGLRLLAMSLGYGLYLLVFCSLTIGVSALFPSARAALVSLLAFWAASTLLVPRIAPAIAENLHPTPSAPAFEEAVSEEAMNGVSGHDPRDERLQALKDRLMKENGVTKVEDLPFSFEGVALEFGEKNSTDTYNRHYDKLFGAYREQTAIQQAFSVISPNMAMTPWSRAFAGTDFAAHRLFLRDAEDYRYKLVQALNNDITLNKPNGFSGVYRTDVSAIADRLKFEPRITSPSEAWTAQKSNLLILSLWAVASLAFAAWAATRLERTT